MVQQSGAIVVRRDAREPRVLLVTSKRNPGQWIFPKGHVEKGETAQDGALREALEEAGVLGTSIGRAGVIKRRFLGLSCRIDYFLAELILVVGPPEAGRKRIWCGFDQALEKLTVRDMRKLLRDAWEMLPG